MQLLLAESVSSELLLIESLLVCDREVQDKERNMITKNNVYLIDRWLSYRLKVYFSLTIQSSSATI